MGKLAWGVRAVGPLHAARGAARFAALRARRPERASVRLRSSGDVLSFDYPGQLVPALVMFGDLIDPEFAFLRRVVRPGWTVLDIGAAIGQFSVFIAGLQPAVVHAFEPSRENGVTFRRNLAANGLNDRVDLHPIALSDQPGSVVFATAANAYLSRIDRVAATSDAGDYTVEVRTLDNVCDELGLDHVSLLKLNVAGFEPQVMDGAERLLREARVDVLVLLIGSPSYRNYAVMASWGYRFFFFHPKRNELHEVRRFDDDGLRLARPWPARHLIAISAPALANGVLGDDVTIAV